MKRAVPTVACAVALLLAGVSALAQSGGYTLDWWTVDDGGGASTGGDYTLSRTSGQADAGTLSGGDYTLEGGFWGADVRYRSLLPLVVR